MEKEKNPVLVLFETDGVYNLKTEYISDDSIPEILNGESGFHIYHVRMLTELILRQLKKNEVHKINEDEITAISIASSLHDIGKMRIPKSILEYPGKLSPLEYDIVKKHSVFGEEIIENIKSDTDPEIIRHAKEIARSHHERCDGTGYPDGLTGMDIPLSAQVVALADAFDALTSPRSYKDAFTQDVAIEMIANGMCGFFDRNLTDCLLQVVNNEILVGIREQIKKGRSVISNENIFTPKRVLFAGNTEYITKKFTDEIFPESKIMILGESNIKNDARIKVCKVKNPPIDAIFETYSFDVIIYLSRELTYSTDSESDAEKLRNILKHTAKTQKDSKFLYLSSLDGAFSGNSDSALLCRSKEDLCEFYREQHGVNLRTIRIPYLYSGSHQKDFLYKLFEQSDKGKIVIDEMDSSRSYFLSMYDLADFINRFFDNWKTGTGYLNVNDEFNLSFKDITNSICKTAKNVPVNFTGENPAKVLNSNNKALRNEYGWFSKISVVEDMEEQYEEYLQLKNRKYTTLWDKIKHWIQSHGKIVKIAELVILFFLTEFLIKITSSAVFFSIVDFRMAFIVIMATVHGLGYGISAAALSSVSWLFAKISSGTNLITIFYEPTNWLAFVFFFLVGALCGYVRLKKDDTIEFLKAQNKLLEDKLVFTRELYTDIFNERRELKKQIIGSKDSFGKIFDVTRNLDTVEPRELYLKIMDTFEDILENKSISVYSVNENSAFGRLEVASRDIISNASRSISLDTYAPIMEKLQTDEIWRNSDLIENMPMYAAGVYRDGKLELLIFIWHADESQRSLYYINLFKILRDLAQISLLRAYDYTQAIYEKQYIEGTRIMTAEAFEKIYKNFIRLAERKVFSYILLAVDSKEYSYKEVDGMLQKRVRVNDILGIDKDGEIKILLSQATERDLDFILPRFESIDLDVTVLKK